MNTRLAATSSSLWSSSADLFAPNRARTRGHRSVEVTVEQAMRAPLAVDITADRAAARTRPATPTGRVASTMRVKASSGLARFGNITAPAVPMIAPHTP